MSPVLHVLLVRHGESTWNAEARWQGQADPPLTALGMDQARAAAAALPPVDRVVASDLERARSTAAAMAEATGRTVEVEPRLRERDAGAFSGLTRAEICERFPGALPDDPARDPATAKDGLVAPPGWEPDEALAGRAWAALDDLARSSTGATTTVVAVSHSGLIYAVEARFTGHRTRLANLEGRWLRHRDGTWALGDRQLLLDPGQDRITRPDQL